MIRETRRKRREGAKEKGGAGNRNREGEKSRVGRGQRAHRCSGIPKEAPSSSWSGKCADVLARRETGETRRERKRERERERERERDRVSEGGRAAEARNARSPMSGSIDVA